MPSSLPWPLVWSLAGPVLEERVAPLFSCQSYLLLGRLVQSHMLLPSKSQESRTEIVTSSLKFFFYTQLSINSKRVDELTYLYLNKHCGNTHIRTTDFWWHSQDRLGVWARGPGGSGDIEVLDFRSSGHFQYKSKLEDPLFNAWNHLNFYWLFGKSKCTLLKTL